ncbi:hypothetical protein Syun_018954 [Stephania yunnanensis]|uniref:Uncharacterized protein n=1 Tax=Stephania yunnanensis TaxID=152371 RepID=A0AAP0IV55_9MAGN
MKELRESGDVKNDAPKPIMTVISDSLNKSERELGSLEHDQIIKKATMMHFGGRPNMKAIDWGKIMPSTCYEYENGIIMIVGGESGSESGEFGGVEGSSTRMDMPT